MGDLHFSIIYNLDFSRKVLGCFNLFFIVLYFLVSYFSILSKIKPFSFFNFKFSSVIMYFEICLPLFPDLKDRFHDFQKTCF